MGSCEKPKLELPATNTTDRTSIFGILYDLGLGSRRWEPIGVKYWYDPGATRNGFYGFCSVLVTAAFAYSGSEVVGLTAYEQAEPKRDMPRAIKQVFWRIGIVSYVKPYTRECIQLTYQPSFISRQFFL